MRRSKSWPTPARLRPTACNAPKSSGAPVVARAPRRLQPGSALMARPCASASWTCFGKVESSLLIEEELHAESEGIYTRVPTRDRAHCRDERALAAAGCGGSRDRIVHPAALDGSPPRAAPG